MQGVLEIHLLYAPLPILGVLFFIFEIAVIFAWLVCNFACMDSIKFAISSSREPYIVISDYNCDCDCDYWRQPLHFEVGGWMSVVTNSELVNGYFEMDVLCVYILYRYCMKIKGGRGKREKERRKKMGILELCCFSIDNLSRHGIGRITRCFPWIKLHAPLSHMLALAYACQLFFFIFNSAPCHCF